MSSGNDFSAELLQNMNDAHATFGAKYVCSTVRKILTRARGNEKSGEKTNGSVPPRKK